MDNKVTLSFNANIIEKGKQYAASQGISLSRLTEILLRKVTSADYPNLEDLPVADWVNMVSEGEAEYITKPRPSKKMKAEFYERKK